MNMLRFGSHPFRLLLVAAAIILLALAPAAAQERDQDPNNGDGVVVESTNGTHVRVDVNVARRGNGQPVETVSARGGKCPGKPWVSPDDLFGGDGKRTFWVQDGLGVHRFWTTAEGDPGLPRLKMVRRDDKWFVTVDTLPQPQNGEATTMFNIGFTDTPESELAEGRGESLYLPGSRKFGDPWKLSYTEPHPDNPGADIKVVTDGVNTRLATAEETAALKRGARAGRIARGH